MKKKFQIKALSVAPTKTGQILKTIAESETVIKSISATILLSIRLLK